MGKEESRTRAIATLLILETFAMPDSSSSREAYDIAGLPDHQKV